MKDSASAPTPSASNPLPHVTRREKKKKSRRRNGPKHADDDPSVASASSKAHRRRSTRPTADAKSPASSTSAPLLSNERPSVAHGGRSSSGGSVASGARADSDPNLPTSRRVSNPEDSDDRADGGDDGVSLLSHVHTTEDDGHEDRQADELSSSLQLLDLDAQRKIDDELRAIASLGRSLPSSNHASDASTTSATSLPPTDLGHQLSSVSSLLQGVLSVLSQQQGQQQHQQQQHRQELDQQQQILDLLRQRPQQSPSSLDEHPADPSQPQPSFSTRNVVFHKGDSCLWRMKATSGTLYHRCTIVDVSMPKPSVVTYKIMLTSHGTVIDDVHHQDLYVDPNDASSSASDPKSTTTSTFLPPLTGTTSIRRAMTTPTVVTYLDKTLSTAPTILRQGDEVYYRHHTNLMDLAIIQSTIMPDSPEVPIKYNLHSLHDASVVFYGVTHDQVFVDCSSPLPDPSQASPPPVPLTALDRLQAAAHPDSSHQDIIRWKALTPAKLNWRHLSKALSFLALEDDTPIAIAKFYRSLQMAVEECHDDAASILPELSSLVPTDTFATRILPPATYDRYASAVAFYTKLANYIQLMLERKPFAATAPAARRGLSFTSSGSADGFARLFAMLAHTMPHLGAMGVNPQGLIDTLILLNGDDVYEFLGAALKVKETIQISKLIPSPNALFTHVLDQLSRSTAHIYHLAGIQTSFTQFIRKNTANAPYTMHDVVSIQQHLVSVNAPCAATIPSTITATPSSERSLLPTSPNPRTSILDATHTNSDDDDDSLDDGLHVRALRPSLRPPSHHRARRAPSPADAGRRASFRRSNSPARELCGFCGQPGHPDWRCERRGPAFWSEFHARRVAQYNLQHGDAPTADQKAQLKSAPPPSPPAARFAPDTKPGANPPPSSSKPTVRAVQAVIDEEAKRLDDEFAAHVSSDGLLHKTLQVRSQMIKTCSNDEVKEIADKFTVDDDDDGSVLPLGSDTSSALDLADIADLDIYDRPVNC